MDSDLWKACAGPYVKLPEIDSLVFYFPQGHAEHAGCPSTSLAGTVPPFFCCRVLAVQLCADPNNDQVYAKITLIRTEHSIPISSCSEVNNHVDDGGDVEEEEEEDVRDDEETDDDEIEVKETEDGAVYCAKVLTQSDANNGGGFSVPKSCADKVFPPLDFEADPPVQEIQPIDIHGRRWKFRHIYRGSPLRHLITTGWSKFVNAKRLMAGDSLIFMTKNDSPDIRIGVRRGRRRMMIEELSRISADDVVTAARLAAEGKPFEVMYEPYRNMIDFVVNADVARVGEIRLWGNLREKTRVEVEVEDKLWYSRKCFRTGSVIKFEVHDPNWSYSIWRAVQVELEKEDEKEGEENEEERVGAAGELIHVNPWSVTVASESLEFTGIPQMAVPDDCVVEPNHRPTEEEEMPPHVSSRDGEAAAEEFTGIPQKAVPGYCVVEPNHRPTEEEEEMPPLEADGEAEEEEQPQTCVIRIFGVNVAVDPRQQPNHKKNK